MNTNEDFDKHPDEQANDMFTDMIDDLETASLEERISFLYEATGAILMNAIILAEKDGRPSVEDKE